MTSETGAGARPVLPGTVAPDYRAPTSKGHTLGPETFTDRLAVVLFFLEGLDEPADREALWSFDALLPEFGARRVQLLGVVTATPRALRAQTDDSAVTVLADEDQSIRNAFGAEAGTFAVVIDRRGVVAAVIREPRDGHAATVLEAVDRLLAERPEDVEVSLDHDRAAAPVAE